eukprot:TRINITY_DN1525_c0_g1_i1.p1 TRINITY_DN1525_c0_g1~~TRINITY_DN1525_c0_g1_i1.p1  ORF type:complete len:268 (+),score=60.14 TRINITY_DN1525_c0_g1_i1:68-805(+)
MAEPIDPNLTTNLPPYKGDKINVNISFKKQNYECAVGLDNTLGEFRQFVAAMTGVAAGLQKLMFKGAVRDDSKTINELGLKEGTKVMLIGSTISEVMSAASAVPVVEEKGKFEEDTPSEPLSEQLPHKKIIDKGIPDGAEPGKKGKQESLPSVPLHDIYNNTGQKVRLTFKEWSQELWIQSASSTQKLPYATIRTVTSEAIKGHEEYHIVILHLGNTDRQKYFLYWVPAQYTRAIKTALSASSLF